MFAATVYRVMIGSLSGFMEEVYTTKEVVQIWNNQNTVETGKLYLPIEWTTNPEEIQNVDVVIGIVGNWVSNQEYIERWVEAGKKVILLFKTTHDSNNTIHSEQEAVTNLKRMMQERCICADYKDKAQFVALLTEQLSSLSFTPYCREAAF